MSLAKIVALALILGAAIAVVSSRSEARPPLTDGNWGQYTRAPGVGPIYGMSFTAPPSYLEDGDDNKLLLRWGELLEIKCRGAQTNDIVLLCLTMALDSTPSFGGGGNCDEGCGEYDDTSGPSGVDGILPCFTIDNGSGGEWRKIELFPFDGSNGAAVVPTSRTGRCTAGAYVTAGAGGAPCDVNAECGALGICTKDGQGPAGVWLIGLSTDAAITCSFELGY